MMDNDQTIAAAMPKILAYNNKDYFEYAGASGGYIDKFGYPFCRGRILNRMEKDTGQYNWSTQIFWASGACMFVRAKAYFDAGELDGDFFAHMEEIAELLHYKNSATAKNLKYKCLLRLRKIVEEEQKVTQNTYYE